MAYNNDKHAPEKLLETDVQRIESNLDFLNSEKSVVKAETQVSGGAQEIKGLTIDGTTYKIQSLTVDQLEAIQWAIQAKANAEKPEITSFTVSPSSVAPGTTADFTFTFIINRLNNVKVEDDKPVIRIRCGGAYVIDKNDISYSGNTGTAQLTNQTIDGNTTYILEVTPASTLLSTIAETTKIKVALPKYIGAVNKDTNMATVVDPILAFGDLLYETDGTGIIVPYRANDIIYAIIPATVSSPKGTYGTAALIPEPFALGFVRNIEISSNAYKLYYYPIGDNGITDAYQATAYQDDNEK